MPRVLVTGGAGYIGSVLVPMLLNAGHEVIVLDNFMYNQTSLLDCCHNKNLLIIRGDSRDEKRIEDTFKNYWPIRYVIPLACIVGAPACDKDPWSARTTNLDAVRMIADRWRPRIIFPNTNSGYGIGQERNYCTEESSLNPVSLYGKLKVEAEEVLLKNGNSVVLRLATVFGISPRMRLDLLVNDFVYRAVNDRYVVLFEGNFKRNYIHVRDVARAFMHCMENFKTMDGQVYNVGLSDANLSKLELCEEIKKQVPGFYFAEAKIGEDPDKRNYIVSNEKIEKTGFKPEVSLQEGIAELIRGYPVIKNNHFSNI
ncbi:MAG: hypothetical protein A3B91_01370 [Candidatus Yanofskybacteria bacterium RIFCSPHIGHO2_02_FULL_41_29]|uniref:NAD-dependent epimerase/dehydratase domain-containing protein n=1 Tax=Candidatus Yanofskybacteria bacterium RIFCSPHIGHO2_01_FULL_41_53 TaxID=1802663 RepID=A0A1F8EGY5_9BACT|nr:MAG: hypothetical protein A2650_03825 [Candidatus Yanofskybacteria bacterium RIFCSPHIGHO2_01_FULL_41_53]OGN10268.1 MAG: hypothetical protein A3B91_01370 [Candidatus Yanofskybacteria bacterium RIFCSPHIGHO2_02_FULL_41_29]OGN16793.1 MAG: hypothetical protein A3F48_00960 [Candidatus Yanofskybacteria bacterium RIFCSPHIGHO2_12_FULL_41_9]OGN24291.1 MAG: hypothetical protein A2916_01345 [Candidatus Yanofskybacteria bacterium RIFCSPLOWO2_01_FULL_41_67]OGN30428.1 MAG: hypothetical protein A3H54_00145 